MKLFDEIIFSIYTVLIILFFTNSNQIMLDFFYQDNDQLVYMLIHLISLLLTFIFIFALRKGKTYEL